MKSLLDWLPWRRSSVSDLEALAGLEDYLEESLLPVRPRQAFVAGLKNRLIMAPEPQLPSIPPVLQFTLLGALGIFSGLLIIITGIRATITLLGALGLLSQLRKRSAPA
jgi:hypothetical protein